MVGFCGQKMAGQKDEFMELDFVFLPYHIFALIG